MAQPLPLAPRTSLRVVKLSTVAHAGLTYRSETKGGLENDARLAIDSYTLVDLRAGLEDELGRWRAMLWGRNVTDEYYWNNVLKAQDNVVRYAGRPSTYGITLSYRF